MTQKYVEIKNIMCLLKGEFANFFIGCSDASKYDIIWTEDGDVIDRFLPEILSFKECWKRVQHVFDKINWRTLPLNHSFFSTGSRKTLKFVELFYGDYNNNCSAHLWRIPNMRIICQIYHHLVSKFTRCNLYIQIHNIIT